MQKTNSNKIDALLTLVLLIATFGAAQNRPAAQSRETKANQWGKSAAEHSFVADLRSTGRNFLFDQNFIWTSPARLKLSDAEWLVPTAGIATGLFMTDTTTSHESTRNHYTQRSVTA